MKHSGSCNLWACKGIREILPENRTYALESTLTGQLLVPFTRTSALSFSLLLNISLSFLLHRDPRNFHRRSPIMEARAHYQRDYSYLGQKDLDLFLNWKYKCSMNGNASDMIHRVPIQGRLPHICVVCYTSVSFFPYPDFIDPCETSGWRICVLKTSTSESSAWTSER